MPAYDFQLPIVALLAAGAALFAAAGAFAFARALRARAAGGAGAAPAGASPAPATRPPPSAPGSGPELRRGLARTRAAFAVGLERLLGRDGALDAKTVEALETLLYGADLGVRAAESLLEAARGADSIEAARAALREHALATLLEVARPDPQPGHPHVALVVGVNGSGKTTSIGKLAARWGREGRRVLVAAGDTFRAAAVEQLGVWAERAGAELVKAEPRGDSAAVAFDAVRAARARDLDAVLVDTAGRLQTDVGLMDELGKIARAIRKEQPDAPHEVILVLDANTGQNAIAQARQFAAAVDVDCILLAKLDGTAKGGVVLGIAREVGLPVRYVGVGEGIDDLVDFEAEEFVEALFAEPAAGSEGARDAGPRRAHVVS